MNTITLNETDISAIMKLVTFTKDKNGVLYIKDVRGNVWGNVEGNVWGDVKGNVEGNVWGSVWGSVWGNAT